MVYQARIPLGRPDVDLTEEQAALIRRVRNGSPLSQPQRGALQAAATFANAQAAAEAQSALDEDRKRQNGRGRR